jgi:hypothetical protein
MQKISNDEIGEAWFFVMLVERGFCKEAMQEAQKSAHAETLIPRLRRAWISTAPETACNRHQTGGYGRRRDRGIPGIRHQ